MAEIPSETNATISTNATDGPASANRLSQFGVRKQNVHATRGGDHGSVNDKGDRFDGGLLIARTRSLDETNKTLLHHQHLRQKQYPHHSGDYDHYFMSDEGLCSDENTVSTALHSSFDASLLRGEKSLLKEDDDGSGANFEDLLPSDQECDLTGRKHYLVHSRNDVQNPTGKISITINLGEASAPEPVHVTQATKARRITNEIPYLPKTPGRPILRHFPGATVESMKPVFNSPPPSSAVKRRRAASLQHPRPSPMRRVLPSRISLAQSGAPFTSSSSILFPGNYFGNHHHQQTTQGLLMTPLVSQANIPCSASSPSNFHVYNTATNPSPFASEHPPAMTPTCPANLTSNASATDTGAVKRMPYYTGTTVGSTPLETTIEIDSIETSSPARFRFTSFPASLPRINNPRTRDRQCPDSVRKRMSFGAEGTWTKSIDDANRPETVSDGAGVNQSCEVNQSRDDEGTHNTSISSLSAEGHQHLLEAPSATSHLATRTMKRGIFFPNNESHDLYGEDHGHFGYSDDEDEDQNGDTDSDKKRGRAGRTRLDFNVLVSPPHKQSDPNNHASNPLEGKIVTLYEHTPKSYPVFLNLY
jgi:hypothetical protein